MARVIPDSGFIPPDLSVDTGNDGHSRERISSGITESNVKVQSRHGYSHERANGPVGLGNVPFFRKWKCHPDGGVRAVRPC
eukprot:1352660-Amorphochlora_amoeboformis.AAC.2